MTGEVVNLRRARKARARVADEGRAAANRAAFGRTGAAKKAATAEADRHRRSLDGARLAGEDAEPADVPQASVEP